MSADISLAPNLPSVMALYWIKYFVALIGGWAFWCSFNTDYPGFTQVADWAFTIEAFKKAIVWSMTCPAVGAKWCV